jgi:hypothetical protein
MSENNEVQSDSVESPSVEESALAIPKSKKVPETLDNNVISSPETGKKGGKRTPALKPIESGAIGSSTAEVVKTVKKAVVVKAVEKVALFSTKNVSWPGVGSVSKGYNFVTKDQATKWLTRNHIREAAPQEVANNLKG